MAFWVSEFELRFPQWDAHPVCAGSKECIVMFTFLTLSNEHPRPLDIGVCGEYQPFRFIFMIFLLSEDTENWYVIARDLYEAAD